MTTTSGPTLGPQIETHVKDMPPLVVTTTGIPDAEHHADAPPTVTTSRWTRWAALALAGVLAIVVGAIVYVFLQPVEVTTTTTQTGSSISESSDYLAGKRAAAAAAVGVGVSPSSVVQQVQTDRLTHYPVW